MHFRELFYPQSVAVIGASSTPGSVGNDLVKNLVKQGYKGQVYPVNPKGGEIMGLVVKKSLADIKKPVDLAVVAVPAAIVPGVLQSIGEHGTRAVVVISAGFKEIGKADLEIELQAVAKRFDLTLIGPNCLGIINAEASLNASFAAIMPDKGPIAFISQSGAICTSILDYARERGLGFSKFVSVGNKAVISETELLRYLYHDPQTKVILMYVEQLQQVAELMRIARQVTRGTPHKPIIILKSGRTAAGAKASASHTGALSGNDAAYDALFAQAGIIRAETVSELFDFAECFSHNKPLRDNRIAIVTNAGGPGVVTTDAAVADGLELARLQPETVKKLHTFLPAAANMQNPIDMLGDANAERYEQTLTAIIEDPGVDGVVIILTPQSMTEVEKTAQVISRLRKKTTKPLIASFMGDQAVAPGLTILHKQGVATTDFPEPAAKALSVLHHFKEWLTPKPDHQFRFKDIQQERAAKLFQTIKPDTPRLLNSRTTFAILEDYGFPLVKRHFVTSAKDLKYIKSFKLMALKIASPDISHKTEVGGVILNVTQKDLAEKYAQLLAQVKKHQPSAKIEGVEVMEMVIGDGLEIILGASTDPQLGKVGLVGWGGIYTEVFKDVSLGLLPVSRLEAVDMVNSLTVDKILDGFRDQPKLDEATLVNCLGRLSELVTDFPQIKEIDINPLKVLPTGRGAVVLDARIILE